MKEQNKNALMLAAAGVGTLMAARSLLRRWNEYDLRGRTALITGGSRGLGLVLAREFASEGARVAICARDPVELERARRDLAGRGAEVLAVPCDVTERAQVNELVQLVRGRFGRIDVLVNNAGVIQVGPVEVMTVEDYEEALKIHFWGPLYTTLAALPDMRRRREGRIVNISSIGGKIGVPHLVPYSASKFALVGLSEGLRAELSKDGILVTTVCPGLMRTGSPRNATFKGQHRAEYAWFSISDSLPVTSMQAERAARQIIDACKRGDAELILTTQAVVAVKFHQLFPELSADLRGLVNRLLPAAGGIGRNRAKGKDSESELAPSILTALGDQAAVRNNEMDATKNRG
ncbi:MAG TPA: SDR family NAD(P)-dependent oxidoreductase [Pyrinomonadaceae bacterium]|jgi:NAD(P)-dependent dehydrogenase (short-subunit alcohol dehydrogenase family)|nr:SDR family NAD(P)-dependent oxidoreductase [Pyrinomonadaceae bacterium]